MSKRQFYTSQKAQRWAGLSIFCHGPIAEILDRLELLLSAYSMQPIDRIELAEARGQLFRLVNRHNVALSALVLSSHSDLPDPKCRPTYDEARQDRCLASAIGFILRTRDFVERLEAQYRLDEGNHA